jgi:uroporphyrinogen decarboxylase
MNSRERVKKAIKFQKPDLLPISHAVLPAAQIKYGQALQDILEGFRDDFGWDYMKDLPIDEYPVLYKKGDQADDFGIIWHNQWDGICGIPEGAIKDLTRYGEYKWPAPFTAGPPQGRLYSGHMAGFDDRWYARGGWIVFFEQLHYLHGMENVFIAIAGETKEFYQFRDDLLKFNLEWLSRWAKLEYDGIHFADDWGQQHGLMIKPEKWRRIFKPCYAEMFRFVHDAGMDVWFHTDGDIKDIFGDLIEIGVDVINCQVVSVGHDWIARNVRGKIAFRTDIDRQYTLPFGTPSQVKEEVFRTFEACGTADGGIIACGEVGPDVPLENIRAMYKAFAEYKP